MPNQIVFLDGRYHTWIEKQRGIFSSEELRDSAVTR